jgi:hypothetical protein
MVSTTNTAGATYQTPGTDPADLTSLAGAFRTIFKKFMQNKDGMLPATVVSYNRNTNKAVIQPQIMLLSTDGTTMQRAPLASITVLALGGGGVMIGFPVKAGDTGWIDASDRDISLFLQQFKAGVANQTSTMLPPNTLRMHSFSDGRFIPDVLCNYVFPEALDPDTDMCIATTDGEAYIALNSATKNITAYSQTGNATINLPAGTLTAQAMAVSVTSQTTLTLAAAGDIVATCESFLINGVPHTTHTHKLANVAAGSETIESEGPQAP